MPSKNEGLKIPEPKVTTRKARTTQTKAKAKGAPPKAKAPPKSGPEYAILVRQYGYEQVIEFDSPGEMRKAWRDIANRIQNGTSVQIQNHIFIGALQASIIAGPVPETRGNRKERRRREARERTPAG